MPAPTDRPQPPVGAASPPPARRPPPPAIPLHVWKIAGCTAAGAFIAILDSTLVNLALESIRADFDSTLPLVQWVVTGYLIALAVSLPAAGWLGTRHGYGRVWSAALSLFVLGSVLCAIAPGPLWLIAARVVQGLAAGLLVPSGQAVVAAAAGPAQLGRIFGLLGIVVALGPAIGPPLGGLMLEFGSWPWLFWINVPIGLGTLLGARGLVPAGDRDAGRPLDRLGLLLLGIGLPLLLYGATETGASGLRAVPLLATLFGAALVTGFALNAVRARHPLIDLRLLKRSPFGVATVTAGLTGANLFGGMLLLPLYLQLALGRSVAATGMMLLAMGLGTAMALPLAGTLTDRRGAGAVSLAGAALLVITTVPFLLPAPMTMAVMAFVLVVRGAGLALAQLPAMSAAYASVTRKQIGHATTLVNIVQRTGGAAGAAGVVTILAQAGGSTDAVAYRWAFAAVLLLSLFTVVTAALLKRSDEPRSAG